MKGKGLQQEAVKKQLHFNALPPRGRRRNKCNLQKQPRFDMRLQVMYFKFCFLHLNGSMCVVDDNHLWLLL